MGKDMDHKPDYLTLVFNNADAKPRSIVVRCDLASVPHIMSWYGAFYSGDRYTVTLDGRNVPMDHNGEPTRLPTLTTKGEADAG